MLKANKILNIDSSKFLNEKGEYKINNASEKKEVLWLIKEGVYKSIKQYEEFMSKLLSNKLKFE